MAGRRRRRPGGGRGGQQQGTEVELALPTWSRVGRVWGGHMNQTAAPLFAYAGFNSRAHSFSTYSDLSALALRGAKGHVSCDEQRLSRTGDGIAGIVF